jgi:chaperone required for assembly of F1-ATPase
LQVMLDSRPVRTPAKDVLVLPHSKHQLATAIAIEWDLLVSAQQALKQHYIPLTSTTARALDVEVADQKGDTKIREEVVDLVMRYLSTDTLLCWAPEAELNQNFTGEGLRTRQKRMTESIIGDLTTRIWPGIEIKPAEDESSILPSQQSEETKEVIRGWANALPAWELAALERAVLASKSLLIAVRLLADWSHHLEKVHGPSKGAKFGIEEAAEACSLEVSFQTEVWGEVEDTHDVEKEDLRRQLGSAILLVNALNTSN